MSTLLQEIISILVGGISGMAQGIGEGLSTLVQKIFLNSDGNLSTYGGVIIVFAGISLAVGLSRFVVNWVSSLGR